MNLKYKILFIFKILITFAYAENRSTTLKHSFNFNRNYEFKLSNQDCEQIDDCILFFKTEADSLQISVDETIVIREEKLFSFSARRYSVSHWLKNKDSVLIKIEATELDQQTTKNEAEVYIGSSESIYPIIFKSQFLRTEVTIFSSLFCIVFFIFISMIYISTKNRDFLYLIFYSAIASIYLFSFTKIPRFYFDPELFAGNIHFFLRLLQDFILINLFNHILNKDNYRKILHVINFFYISVLTIYVILFFIDNSFNTSHKVIFYAAPLVALPMLFSFILSLNLTDLIEKRILVPITLIFFILQLNDLFVFWNLYQGLYTVKFYIPFVILILFWLIIKRFFQNYYFQQEKITFINTARQVAHDIRSPLSALKMALSDTDRLAENTRLILRNSISRIEDISNDLLERSRSELNTNNDKIHVISALSEIITQKRIEHKGFTNIELTFDFNINTYSCFSNINKTDFSRVLSNIINNSYEAIQNEGKVIVNAKLMGSVIDIKVSDNGSGIKAQNIQKLGSKEFTEGKSNGNGLGLYKANEIIKSLDGDITISSVEGEGTEVIISLPSLSAPDWFARTILIKSEIVILDDDQGMLQTWKKRLSDLGFIYEDLRTYSSANSLLQDIDELQNYTFLLDYEILNENKNGLDIIKALKSKNNAYLITSYYDEVQIQDEIIQLGSRMIPKPLTSIVPIEQKKKIKNIVLIDDDKLIRNSWLKKYQGENIQVDAYDSVEDFIENSNNIPLDAYIFIDSNLSNNIKGEIESEKIFNIGYIKIYLSTGYEAKSIKKPSWIIKVISKDCNILNIIE